MRNEILRFERIRNLRLDRELSQQQIAELLIVKQNTYSQYAIGVLNLRKLAEFHHTSVDYLLGLTDETAPYPRRKG